jgi:hypothetical protein
VASVLVVPVPVGRNVLPVALLVVALDASGAVAVVRRRLRHGWTIPPGGIRANVTAAIGTSVDLGKAGSGSSVSDVDATIATTPAPPVQRSRADVFMRHLLRVDRAMPSGSAAAERVFTKSILISATRCVLTYLVLPFLAPLLGVAAGVGPVLGIVIGVVAIVFNVISMRRFWRADHRLRWAYTFVAVAIIGLLIVLLVRDVSELLT